MENEGNRPAEDPGLPGSSPGGRCVERNFTNHRQPKKDIGKRPTDVAGSTVEGCPYGTGKVRSTRPRSDRSQAR